MLRYSAWQARLGMVALLCLLFLSTPFALALGGQPPDRPLVISFIDIGQGDSALVETPSGKNILIDTGPPQGKTALFKYLKLRKVKKLDMVVISHPHLDHYGNTRAVLQQFPTSVVLDSGLDTGSPTQEKIFQEIKNQRDAGKPIKLETVSAGLAGTSRSLGDGITLQLFQPKKIFQNINRIENNNSIVLKLSLGTVSVLFTGDLEEIGRTRLLQSSADLQSTIYKVAHHGSHNGTSPELLERMQPQEAVISCAKQNSHGHPHQVTLERLDDARARVWRTDKQGTIKLTITPTGYEIFAIGKP